ncbi:hypothetical protein GUJ93_ZPchr0008g12911 [Zizania palustris]|uniref:Protein kinase domain-containing protein n=1 Tax=Zizania palustris TaxID=103762 RepID=A0A8J5RCY5_ZIZPA|nr:hypothetical protein GUJ93_ZPchr0008g12911 [Zizania palustris]
MDLDSGELLAVKQVLIGRSNATREKAQCFSLENFDLGHIKELEDEVKLLKKTRTSHTPILFDILERSFPEAVIRKYTKQILHGLEYLHRNGNGQDGIFEFRGISSDLCSVSGQDGIFEFRGILSDLCSIRWYAKKKFLHPDIVVAYEYIVTWDEDIGWSILTWMVSFS